MWKVAVLLAVATILSVGSCSEPEIVTNPSGYGTYVCPKGWDRVDLDWPNRRHWTFMSWGSTDDELCAIKDTRARCYKPEGGLKYWMTYLYGYGEFHIAKFDVFSFTDEGYSGGGSGSSSGHHGGGGGVSNTPIPVYFAVRAIYFKVRGMTEITIIFQGATVRQITLTSAILDWRKITWICIEWRDSPVFESIWFKFIFDRKQKAKFWELYMVACCEPMTDTITVGKK